MPSFARQARMSVRDRPAPVETSHDRLARVGGIVGDLRQRRLQLLVEDRLLRRQQRNQRRVRRACGRSGARRTARRCRVDVDGRVAPLDPVDGVEDRSLDDCADPAGHRRRRVRRLEPGDHRAVPVGDDVRACHSRRGDECSRMRVEGGGRAGAREISEDRCCDRERNRCEDCLAHFSLLSVPRVRRRRSVSISLLLLS